MPEAISSLPPATVLICHRSEVEGAPDTHEMSFNELWQNKKGNISFSDVLDIVNPLQHMPVVSTVYRMITGDHISMGADGWQRSIWWPYGIVRGWRHCRR